VGGGLVNARLYISSSIALDDRQSNSRRDKVSPVSGETRDRGATDACRRPGSSASFFSFSRFFCFILFLFFSLE
jgi:hypothetical protein